MNERERRPVSKLSMEVNDQFLLKIREKASFKVRPKVIGPSKSATFATSQETSKFRDSPPTALAIGEDEIDKLLVLFSSPWPLLQPNFITTRLSSHNFKIATE